MSSVTVAKLKDDLDAVLRSVEAGEVVEIFRDGRPVARLVRAAAEDPGRSHLPEPLDLGGVILSAEILKDRESSR